MRGKRWPFFVTKLVTHFWTHLEEHTALWDARRAGERIFRGIRTASFMLADAGMFTPDGRSGHRWERDGILPIGVWGGHLDEHSLPTEEQNAGACAATLMASWTGSDQDEAMTPILGYVSRNDSEGGAGPWDLASLVKRLNDYYDFQGRMAAKRGKSFPAEAQFWKVHRFVAAALSAQHAKNCGLLRYRDGGQFSDPERFVSAWLVARFGDRDLSLTELFNEASRADCRDPVFGPISDIIGFALRSSKEATSQDFATVMRDLEAYFRYVATRKERSGESFSVQEQAAQLRIFAFDVLDAEYSRQREFIKATELKESNRSHTWKVRGANGRIQRLAVLTTSNREAHKAARAQKPTPHVVIQRRGNGQVTIFGNRFLALDRLTERIKREERLRGNLPPQEVERRWYHFHRNNANQLINGGLSAPNVSPTCLPLGLLQQLTLEEMKNINTNQPASASGDSLATVVNTIVDATCGKA